MSIQDKIKTRWASYQPNKNSLYKAVGYTAFLTMAVGFTVGGWTTQGSAEDMVSEARIEYAAALCAERFMAADLSGQRLAELKQVAGRHQRSRVLSRENWLVLPAGSTPEFAKQAQLACGEQLVGIDHRAANPMDA
ncbi:MAG: hypothetical protein WD382_02285 [Halofilum sp. (in: g-proteobacteria)]